MNASLKCLLGGLAVALFSLSAAAQPGPGRQDMTGMGGMSGMSGMGGMGGMSGMSGMGGMQATGAMNARAAAPCGKARDPQRCEALQQAKETCKDKVGPDKRKCMGEAMPPMDCSKARNPARCEATQKAKEACKDKMGPEHRQCMRDQMPKPAGKGKN